MNTNTVNRVAKGECPLCYTDNPYTQSICAECYLPLPWARADMAEREPSGQCLRCQTDNPYTCLNCSNCGGRLPWANAVSAATGTDTTALGRSRVASTEVGGHKRNIVDIKVKLRGI